MRQKLFCFAMSCVSFAMVARDAIAQAPLSAPPPKAAAATTGSSLNVKPSGTAPAAPIKNDPTVPGPAIRDLLNNTPKEPGGQAPSALPNMTLKALIAFKNKPAVAVIEIGGRSVTIRAGDEFTVPADGELVPVRVAVLSSTLR